MQMKEHTETMPHTDIVKRLKRANGHLKSIIEMLESGRDCLEIAQQMQAVEKAITNAKKLWYMTISITVSNMLPLMNHAAKRFVHLKKLLNIYKTCSCLNFLLFYSKGHRMPGYLSLVRCYSALCMA